MSNLAKRFFIIDSDAYNKIKEKLQRLESSGGEVQLKQYNQDFMQGKKLDENTVDKGWKDLSKRVTPILQNSLQSTPSVSAPQPAVSNDSEMVQSIEKEMGGRKNSVKALRLFYFLNSLPGVQVNAHNCSIDGKIIPGSAVQMISNLVRSVAWLGYDLRPILQRAVQAGEATTLKRLMENREGKKILNEMEDSLETKQKSSVGASPLLSSTPVLKKSPVKRRLMSNYANFRSPIKTRGRTAAALASVSRASEGTAEGDNNDDNDEFEDVISSDDDDDDEQYRTGINNSYLLGDRNKSKSLAAKKRGLGWLTLFNGKKRNQTNGIRRRQKGKQRRRKKPRGGGGKKKRRWQRRK